MAYQTNFELWAGDDKDLSIQLRNDAGVVVPLTDVTAISFVIKLRQETPTAIVTKTLGSGITKTDEVNGVYEVAITSDDTDDLDGAYYWESTVTDQADGLYTAAYGYVAIHGKVTKRTSYCTLEEALALIADVQVTTNTTPSLATAQIIVETIARDIDGILLGRGYALPIEDTNALEMLRTINQYGAAAAIIKSKKPIDTGMGSDRGAFGYYENKYREKLLQLQNPEFSLITGDIDADESIMGAGWVENTDISDEVQYPFWTRETEF